LRLTVPQLQVSAPVVGIAAEQGSLTPPSNPQKLGWWSGGAQPGAKLGSAVITGHTVHTGGGAFDNLNQLQPGDAVGVTTSRGQLSYRVTTVTAYRKQTLAKNAARVFDQTVPGRLVLITCEDWNGKVYLSNTVVIAQRVA
jgi:LPXTG-site transpeptidase (sortase) family protein